MSRKRQRSTATEVLEPPPATVAQAAPAPAVRLEFLLPILVCVLVVGLYYRSPWSAGDLEVVPDSVEYAVGAQRLATTGHYTIVIDGKAYPPRYPLWFPLVLAPLYMLGPRELGIGILGVIAFDLLAALATYRIGRRLAGEWGGCLSVAFVMLSANFTRYGRQIMMDGPATALGLVACALYLRLREKPNGRDFLLAGAAVALAAGFRNTFALLFLPFLVLAIRPQALTEDGGRGTDGAPSGVAASPLRRVAASVFLLLLPGILVGAGTLFYNHSAFGSWTRNGYQLWCAVPYDYLSLTFSPSYLLRNLHELAASDTVISIGMAAAGIAAVWRRRPSPLRPLLEFLLLGPLPVSVLQLFYFSAGERFHLLTLAVLRLIGAAGIAARLPGAVTRRRWALAGLVAAGALAAILLRSEPEPLRREVVETMGATLPRNAVIITILDPVFLEPYVLRGTQRQELPICRRVEYASKLVCYRKVPRLDPPPVSEVDHHAEGLLRGGCLDPCPYTALESPGRIEELARQGLPVYLDSGPYTAGIPEWKALWHRYHWAPDPRCEWLDRLQWP